MNPFDFSPFISPVTGKAHITPALKSGRIFEGDREGYGYPSVGLMEVRNILRYVEGDQKDMRASSVVMTEADSAFPNGVVLADLLAGLTYRDGSLVEDGVPRLLETDILGDFFIAKPTEDYVVPEQLMWKVDRPTLKDPITQTKLMPKPVAKHSIAIFSDVTGGSIADGAATIDEQGTIIAHGFRGDFDQFSGAQILMSRPDRTIDIVGLSPLFFWRGNAEGRPEPYYLRWVSPEEYEFDKIANDVKFAGLEAEIAGLQAELSALWVVSVGGLTLSVADMLGVLFSGGQEQKQQIENITQNVTVLENNVFVNETYQTDMVFNTFLSNKTENVVYEVIQDPFFTFEPAKISLLDDHILVGNALGYAEPRPLSTLDLVSRPELEEWTTATRPVSPSLGKMGINTKVDP